VKTRGLSVRSGGSGRRRRETSCPSIHCATGLIPRGREIGREPRARVQVDRLVGWQKSVGRISICIGRSKPEGSPENADACSRWKQGEPVRHASNGTLQIREKQTTQSACALRVRTRPKASRLEAVCALYGVHAPRAWSCGFFKAARRLGPFVWCLRDDFETSEVGSIAMKALPATEARRVSRAQVQWLMSRCASERTASTSSPSKLARLNTASPSPRVQVARTALGLERPPPSP